MKATLTTKQNISSPPEPLPLIARLFLTLTGGVVLFLVLLSVLGFGYDSMHRGKIFPGVAVAGIDLSSMDPVTAAAELSRQVSYPQTGRIVFQDGERLWEAKPSELGLSLNLEETVRQAYSLGRSGNPLRRVFAQLGAWYNGQDLPPVMNYDEYSARAYLSGIAAQIDQPMQEASLSLNGTEVVETPGQIGRQVNLAATMAPLEMQMTAMMDGLQPLVVQEVTPTILDVSEAATETRNLLNSPLTLSVPDAEAGDPGPWVIQPEQLAEMVVFTRLEAPEGGSYTVSLDVEKLRPILNEAAVKLSRQPANARFVFNDETRQLDLIQPAVIGRSLDIEASLQAVQTESMLGGHNTPLVVEKIDPPVKSDATAESLGIRELVSQHTSYFYGSSAPRIQNIQTAAGRFHGVLVAPGETFSMAEVMGDVSLDTGYAEALIIFGGRTIEGVGGGVCQVSTTLFRTAFLGGYPIVERNPHAYRVGYYEQTASGQIDSSLAGLDATVFVPVVDFKFTNDSPNWLLMETYVNAKTRKLTWKFYSTSDGRTVEWNTSGLLNVKEPPEPKYIENPDLAPGEINQVDWSVDGADVNITRTVYRNGEIYFQDQYSTHYQPWQAVFEYGPGTKLPKQKD